VRENRTHGSEGGDGASRSRPLSGLFSRALAWIPAFAGMTDPCGLLVARIIAAQVFSMEITKDMKVADGIVSELRALRVLRGDKCPLK